MLDRIALWEYRIKTVSLYGPAIWVIFYIAHTDNSRQTHTHSSFNMSIMTARLSTVLCVTMQHIHINDGKQTNMNLSGPTQIERKKGNLSCVHGTETSLTENPWETKEQKRLSHTFTLRLCHCQTAMAGSLNTTLQKVYVSLHTVIMTQNVMLVLKVTSANNKTLNKRGSYNKAWHGLWSCHSTCRDRKFVQMQLWICLCNH